MNVFWAYLEERSIPGVSLRNALDIAEWAVRHNCGRISVPYLQTCAARNQVVEVFLENTSDPDDAVVMLDCDQIHPADVIGQLIANKVDVVAALSQCRSYPYPGMFFQFPPGNTDELLMPKEWPDGLVECEAVATGAIAIRRRVFDRLQEAGYGQPYFRYRYIKDRADPQTEDVVFCLACREAGIKIHVDTRIRSPHQITTLTTPEQFFYAMKNDPTQEGKYL